MAVVAKNDVHGQSPELDDDELSHEEDDELSHEYESNDEEPDEPDESSLRFTTLDVGRELPVEVGGFHSTARLNSWHFSLSPGAHRPS